MLEEKYFKLAARERGRSRSFLLKSLKHFLINEWERGQSQKRGGGQKIFSLDDEPAERTYLPQPAADHLAPESLYDRLWATTLLERAIERLGANYAATGKRKLFDQLKPLLQLSGRAMESDRRFPEKVEGIKTRPKCRRLRFLQSYPRPDVEIATIDFVSAMTECYPFLVAITAE